MTLAIDIPAPSARAERNGVVHFVLRLFREKPLGAAGAVVFVLFLFCGIFADALAPYGMNQIAPLNRLKPPSWAFPFGTNELGQDVFSLVVAGTRVSLLAGLAVANGVRVPAGIEDAVGPAEAFQPFGRRLAPVAVGPSERQGHDGRLVHPVPLRGHPEQPFQV